MSADVGVPHCQFSFRTLKSTSVQVSGNWINNVGSDVPLPAHHVDLLSRYSFFTSSYYIVLFTYVQLYVVHRPFLNFYCLFAPLTIGLYLKIIFCRKIFVWHVQLKLSTPLKYAQRTTNQQCQFLSRKAFFEYIQMYLFARILSIGFNSFYLPLIFIILNLLNRRSVILNTMVLLQRIRCLLHISHIFTCNCHWVS